MRVLKIIHTMGHGGAENIFRWLAWRLRKEGIDAVAGIPMNNDQLNHENWITPALEELGVPYETFDKTGSAFNMVKSIKNLIKKIKPDIVHSHLLDSNFYSSLACKWLSIPHVCTEHGDVSIKTSLSSRIKFYLLSVSSNSVVCVSESIKKSVSKFSIFPGKLEVIYNGINFYKGEEPTFRNEFGIPDKALLIGNVGNLYPVKGQKYLIQAFARFLKSFPDAYLVLVGRGGERKKLEDLAKSSGIPEGKVIFTGFRDDIGNIIKSFDIYVQPSLSEGHPVSLLEAMSVGIPVIATNVGGIPEILVNNNHGLLVPPGSWEDLYKSMVIVKQDLEMYRENAMISKVIIRENFSLERMTHRYIELYKKILAN